MAGFSLAFYLNESRLREKKTLIIDRDAKDTNDHTWCFWQKEKSAFEEIIFRKWRGVWFHGTNDFSKFLDLGEYEYKMIRAADFYAFIRAKLDRNQNFTFLQTNIKLIVSGDSETVVKTDEGEFAANEFVFDSFTRKSYDNPKYQNLWQHFAGWTIQTKENIFKPNEPTLFDFRVEQKDECRFVYVLPFSANEALIELTVFSDNILQKDEYEFYLKKYVAEILKIENYEIVETENGVIPMSDEPHVQFPSPKIIRIGTAGGYVKPSTGYSFERAQHRLQNLVNSIAANSLENQKRKMESRSWKSYLDRVLLNVLRTKKHPADDVFTHLFERNQPSQVLKFLDEDTTFPEDLQIMQTVPLASFTKAAVEAAVGKIKR